MSTINEGLKATGQLVITVRGEDGKVKDERKVSNLVVTTGRNFIASRMANTSPSGMSHMGVGSGVTAPALGDTALESQLGSRVSLTSSTTDANVTTYTATFAPGEGSGAVTEAGIFNAATAGTMLCRTTFDVVNKGAGDTLAISWSVTIN